MRPSEATISNGESPRNIDTDSDRYPTLNEVLSSISTHIDDGNIVVERVEVTALANGECTYRYWEPRSEEPEGGFMPSPEAD